MPAWASWRSVGSEKWLHLVKWFLLFIAVENSGYKSHFSWCRSRLNGPNTHIILLLQILSGMSYHHFSLTRGCPSLIRGCSYTRMFWHKDGCPDMRTKMSWHEDVLIWGCPDTRMSWHEDEDVLTHEDILTWGCPHKDMTRARGCPDTRMSRYAICRMPSMIRYSNLLTW